jgi:hypothetical protein
MSSYITIIAVVLIVASPLLIPTAVTIVHALGNLRRNARVVNPGIDRRHPVRTAA